MLASVHGTRRSRTTEPVPTLSSRARPARRLAAARCASRVVAQARVPDGRRSVDRGDVDAVLDLAAGRPGTAPRPAARVARRARPGVRSRSALPRVRDRSTVTGRGPTRDRHAADARRYTPASTWRPTSPTSRRSSSPPRRSRPSSPRWASRSPGTTPADRCCSWACSRARSWSWPTWLATSRLPLEFDFMAVSSYGAATKTSGVVRILKDLDHDLEGLDVLLVEDIVDSGLTLEVPAEEPRRAQARLARGRRPAPQDGPAEGAAGPAVRRLRHPAGVRRGLRPRLRRAVPQPALRGDAEARGLRRTLDPPSGNRPAAHAVPRSCASLDRRRGHRWRCSWRAGTHGRRATPCRFRHQRRGAGGAAMSRGDRGRRAPISVGGDRSHQRRRRRGGRGLNRYRGEFRVAVEPGTYDVVPVVADGIASAVRGPSRWSRAGSPRSRSASTPASAEPRRAPLVRPGRCYHRARAPPTGGALDASSPRRRSTL